MRRFIVLMMLAGAFFGGYQTGRLPGSPDLIPIARDAYNQAADICARLIVIGREAARKLPSSGELALTHNDKAGKSAQKDAPAR
jgi:hypothetical protein